MIDDEQAQELAAHINAIIDIRHPGWRAVSKLLLHEGPDGLWDGDWQVVLQSEASENGYIIRSLRDWSIWLKQYAEVQP